METIPKESCVKIGFIQKQHGINGELVLKFQEEFYETLEEQPNLFIEIEGLLVPYFIEDEQLRLRSNESAIAKLEWIDTEIKAKELVGCTVYVKKEDLHVFDQQMNIDELVGYTLFDNQGQQIGEVEAVYDYSGNLILAVNFQKKEVLIPFNHDLLIDLDEQNKTLTLEIPEGLLNLE